MILRRTARASDLVTGGLDTVGLRVPAHAIAQELLRLVGGGVAAPSANRFGRVSPTTAEHVLAELDGLVDLILDGGRCAVGVESTIVDLSRGRPVVLRPGGVTAEQLAAVLGKPSAPDRAAAPRVSGSLPSHYAPRARVELVASDDMARRTRELRAQGHHVAVLCRGGTTLPLPAGIVTVPVSADDAALAQELYAALRRVDELGCDVVLATMPLEEGIGVAIADRLRKAAAPREG
jgi:L-threonylcarbamoyladenylate synthase